MEIDLNEKASYAFYGNVLKNYNKFIKPLQKYMTTCYLDDKSHEIVVLNAICKFLSEKIRIQIPTIVEIKQNFNKKTLQLFKQDLDLIEFNQKFKKREDKLKTYFKLHYALDSIDAKNYDLTQASLLMAIYSKVVSCELQPNGKLHHYGRAGKTTALKDSLIYRYLDIARKEEKYNITLRQMGEFKISTLVNDLYNSIAIFDYVHNNTVIDLSLGQQDDGTWGTIFHQIAIIDLENNPDTYKDFIKLVEDNFDKKLIQEMHTLDNGMMF